MTAKEFLHAVRSELMEIKIKRGLLEQLRSRQLPGGIRYDKERVQSALGNVQEDLAIDIVDREREIERSIEMLNLKRAEAYKLIDSLEDSKERQVLMMYFLFEECYKISEVGKQIGYSTSHVYRVYREGLDKIEQVGKKMIVDNSK